MKTYFEHPNRYTGVKNPLDTVKNCATVEKTSERGLQFKNGRYLNADTIQTMKAKDLSKFKGVCQASMKKEKRFVEMHLCRKSSKVISIQWS